MALYPSDHTLHLSSDKNYQGMSFADTLYPSSDDREENLDLQGKEGLPLINKESDKGGRTLGLVFQVSMSHVPTQPPNPNQFDQHSFI